MARYRVFMMAGNLISSARRSERKALERRQRQQQRRRRGNGLEVNATKWK